MGGWRRRGSKKKKGIARLVCSFLYLSLAHSGATIFFYSSSFTALSSGKFVWCLLLGLGRCMGYPAGSEASVFSRYFRKKRRGDGGAGKAADPGKWAVGIKADEPN
ncbi:hypothetical protein B0T21DRAFT_374014 [Apiosordaria backusii]|uniref:Uncharacterized protein n=1 Tax=Apiosordaria backusii TaxID=314023 RepID=A0AA40E122_9PEZI|nr:hypothetical protein B0T21DRAFT_374014 [Apiosordaria backusii]